MALFAGKKTQYKNIELTRFLGRLLGYGLDLKTALSEVRCFAHLLGVEKDSASSTGFWTKVSRDVREGWALSGALEKNGSPLTHEDIDQIRKAEKEGTLPSVLGNMGSLLDSAFGFEDEQLSHDGLEAATVGMVDNVLNDALNKKAEQICLSRRPLVEEQTMESKNGVGEDLDAILSELSADEEPPSHISIMETGNWKPYSKVPFIYFDAVMNCILYRAGLPYWEQNDMRGKFQVRFNEEPVDIVVNYYPGKQKIYFKLHGSL